MRSSIGHRFDAIGDAVEVYASGDIAGEVGVFTLGVPGEAGATKVTGKHIVIWKRSGDTWQLHRDIWNTD